MSEHMSQKEYLKARYERLKAERRCVVCTVPLPDDSKKARCPSCLRKNADAVDMNRKYYGGGPK